MHDGKVFILYKEKIGYEIICIICIKVISIFLFVSMCT